MQSRKCVLFHHLLLGALALLCSDTAAEVPADCAHDGKTYRPGEAFSPDVCTHCVCPRTGGPNADCFKTRCPGPLYHRGCIKWEAVKGSCCQRCVARGCRVGNASYPFGALVPTSDPCLKCQCSAQLPHGDIVCMAVMCAMPPCVDRRRREGECCETCPNGPNCQIGEDIVAVGDSRSKSRTTLSGACRKSTCTCVKVGSYRTAVRCRLDKC